MKFYAYHGVYEAERRIGTTYEVDVRVTASVGKAVETDDLANTINYETIYQICRIEMSKPRQLLESVLSGIVEGIKKQFLEMEGLEVSIKKMHPPLGGRVAYALLASKQNYKTSCPRCKKDFIRYNENDCFERFPNLHPATREMLNKQYDDKCLCDKCLRFYAG
ncbi:MAG: dihydroneopterin aldolase [Bacteroidetes bacterium]|nr:dihydroneopterin aldolase [Bacteroidota bacterium]